MPGAETRDPGGEGAVYVSVARLRRGAGACGGGVGPGNNGALSHGGKVGLLPLAPASESPGGYVMTKGQVCKVTSDDLGVKVPSSVTDLLDYHCSAPLM
jgi:hypothetical protein